MGTKMRAACAERLGVAILGLVSGQILNPETFLNYRDPNVRFAGEENEIFVTVTT
jgi:hypothetical protein